MKISDQFLASVLEGTCDLKRRRSIERVRDACDALFKLSKGSTVTIADVGRYCERKWGGPKTQSIRNSNQVLEKYIKLRIAEHDISSSDSKKALGKSDLNLANPVMAQQQYALALAEIEELRKERIRLLGEISRYGPVSCEDLLDPSIKLERNGRVCATEELRIDDARQAVFSLLNKDRLTACELELTPSGFLINVVSGNHLLTRDEVNALRGLAHSNAENSEREGSEEGNSLGTWQHARKISAS